MLEKTSELLAYYSTPGPMTDPGPYVHLFDGLPDDIEGIVQIVQNNLLHIFWARGYGIELSEKRQQEVNLRWIDRQLARLMELDPRPLTEPRPAELRLVGNCRDFTGLMVSILRHKGIPARSRCGFGTYFTPNHYEDHWVCEYWNAEQQRWVLVDSQLDKLQQETLKLDFDPLDTPRDRFIVAGKAWQMCRNGQANPGDFGIFDMHGLWFVRGDLIRDFLAFSKVEILPWDGGWGFLTEAGSQEDSPAFEKEYFDRIAALTLAGDEAYPEIRDLFETDERWNLAERFLREMK